VKLLGMLLTLFAASVFQAHAAPTGAASALQSAPMLDGVVRNDAAWANVQPMTGFTQVQPVEGASASQRTEVFLGFTDDTLYVGVVCYDDEPGSIIVSNSRRDSDLDQEDSFRLVIDSFRSEQDGFVFGTNPASLQYDGQLDNTGSNRFRSNGFNTNWDTTWDVVSTIGEHGWSAEFAIPFKSLRYGPQARQTWNVNFQRNIRRNNEVVYWAPLPLQYSLNRLSLAGSVEGIDVPAQRNLKFTPYMLAKIEEGGALAESQDDSEVGFDIKYSITPSLTMDVTYNTDFAQVEADQQQVNLDRFSLFFPEKRPFFLENASLFEVGVPRQLALFFSRNIGIGPNGEQVPINAGARLSGKIGSATNVGFLHMQSEGVNGVALEADFSVARVNHELENRSFIGGLFVNRDDADGDNQTYAIDGQWGVGENTTFSGFLAKTETQGISDDDLALRISGAHDGELWSYNASYMEVGAGFNPEVGFLSRRDYRNVNLYAQRRIRFDDSSRILEFSPHASYSGYWNFNDVYETGRLHVDNSIRWKNGSMLATAVNFTHEGVTDAFEIVEGVVVPQGEYDHEELSIFSSTDNSAPLSVFLSLTAGGFFGGDRLSVSPAVTYRIGETFSARLSVNHNDVDLPGGDFEVNLTQLRLSYSFTPKISIQAFVQHNDRDELLAMNLRFSWLRSANSGLYVVYNETDDDLTYPGRPRREFIIKYSHIFDVL
jgi:hypothetical protein